MLGKAQRAWEDDGASDEDGSPDVDDERVRRQCLAVLQWMQARGFVQALVALEQEAGLSYSDGDLPVAAVLEASLDMFGSYHRGGDGADGPAGCEADDELQRLEAGVCCTGPAGGMLESLGANVTAAAWVAEGGGELLAVATTADRRLRLLDSEGQVLASLEGLSSPVLSLDTAPGAPGGGHDVLLGGMGGEVCVLHLHRRLSDGSEGGWVLEQRQRFCDHTKHVNGVRLAPAEQAGQSCTRFLTVSKDHQARLYSRGPGGEFSSAGDARFAGEVTCCCWADSQTFALAARDDHYLHYWDAGKDKPSERLKTNLNALGDSVVSFAVLALAMSPDGKLIAACTDKSRVLVLRAFTSKQLRNLYGAVIDEYDVPSVCFSLDSAFLYASSSLSAPIRKAQERYGEGGDAPMLGEVVVFQLRTGEPVLRLPCHSKAVRCMSRHPLEEALVTGSFDRTVRFWS